MGLLKSNIPSEARVIQDLVRKMVKDNDLKLKFDHWYETEQFPVEEIVSMLRKDQLISLDTKVDEKYGCFKVDYLTYGLFAEELERIDSGLRSFLPSVMKGLVRNAIYEFGSEEQKEKYLPGLADGSLIGCFGLTGEHGGSDPKWMSERAVRRGDVFILNGGKNWITNGYIADFTIAWFQTGKMGDSSTIRGFIVDKGTPGFAQYPIKLKTSLRASDTGSLKFEDCEVPFHNLLPKVIDKGLRAAYECLNNARYTIGWGMIGIVKACLEDIRIFTASRIIRDSRDNPMSLKDSPVIIEDFGEIGDCLITMEERAWDIAREIDEKGGIITDILAKKISHLKLSNVADAMYAVNECRKILASNGLLMKSIYHTPRHYLNLPAVETYEGTPRMHKFILGNYFSQ